MGRSSPHGQRVQGQRRRFGYAEQPVRCAPIGHLLEHGGGRFLAHGAGAGEALHQFGLAPRRVEVRAEVKRLHRECRLRRSAEFAQSFDDEALLAVAMAAVAEPHDILDAGVVNA